jgi:hypothetical protein
MKEPLPYLSMAEAVPFFVDTAPGMFAWRQMSVDSLLSLPSFEVPGLTAEQNREAMESQTAVHRPLTALAMFWTIVALEDLFRQMGTRLSSLEQLKQYFGCIADIAPTENKKKSYLNFTKLNEPYLRVFDVRAVDEHLIPRLNDLVNIRNIVAHHGAIYTALDEKNFEYYQLQPDRVINPPVAFVRETRNFVHGVGSTYLRLLRKAVFDKVLGCMAPLDICNPPQIIIDLIHEFHYFGKLPLELPRSSQSVPTTIGEWRELLKRESEARKQELTRQCLAQLPSTD